MPARGAASGLKSIEDIGANLDQAGEFSSRCLDLREEQGVTSVLSFGMRGRRVPCRFVGLPVAACWGGLQTDRRFLGLGVLQIVGGRARLTPLL